MKAEKIPTIAEMMDLSYTIAAPLFEGKTYAWEVLPEIESYILQLGPTLPADEFDNPSEGVWIAKDAKVFPSAYIGKPCIIDHGAEVRHCAFIRGSAIVGKGATVGNSVELKNVILFDGVETPHYNYVGDSVLGHKAHMETPHYNYVGDSVLGHKAHMGAGSITSNVKADRQLVTIKAEKEQIFTGRKKVGAMLGDFAEIGCNCVLNPGTVVGAHSNVYPTSSVRGVIPANSIYKSANDIVEKQAQK